MQQANGDNNSRTRRTEYKAGNYVDQWRRSRDLAQSVKGGWVGPGGGGGGVGPPPPLGCLSGKRNSDPPSPEEMGPAYLDGRCSCAKGVGEHTEKGGGGSQAVGGIVLLWASAVSRGGGTGNMGKGNHSQRHKKCSRRQFRRISPKPPAEGTHGGRRVPGMNGRGRLISGDPPPRESIPHGTGPLLRPHDVRLS